MSKEIGHDKRYAKIFIFKSLPDEGIHLTEFEMQVLESIRKFGEASIDDVMGDVYPDYNSIKGETKVSKSPLKRIRQVRKLYKLSKEALKLKSASQVLGKNGCILFNLKGL